MSRNWCLNNRFNVKCNGCIFVFFLSSSTCERHTHLNPLHIWVHIHCSLNLIIIISPRRHFKWKRMKPNRNQKQNKEKGTHCSMQMLSLWFRNVCMCVWRDAVIRFITYLMLITFYRITFAANQTRIASHSVKSYWIDWTTINLTFTIFTPVNCRPTFFFMQNKLRFMRKNGMSILEIRHGFAKMR